MATKYGLPYFLEDKTGRLSGSEFADLHDRMKLVYRARERTSSHSSYEVYDITISSYDAFHAPVATLTFGANNALGTITYARDRTERQMESYLSQVNAIAG